MRVKKILVILFLSLIFCACEKKLEDDFVLDKEYGIKLPSDSWAQKITSNGEYYTDLDDIVMITTLFEDNLNNDEIFRKVKESYNFYKPAVFGLHYNWKINTEELDGVKIFEINTGVESYPKIYGRFISGYGKVKLASICVKKGNDIENLKEKVFGK